MENTRFCVKCGKKIPLNSDFCPYCGASQPDIQADKNVTTPEPTKTESGNQSNTAQSEPTESAETGSGTHIGIGWLCAAVSLFVPIVGVAGIILGKENGSHCINRL